MPKLLIVDDETDIREFASNFFKKRKIHTLTAENGKEALSLIEQERPDLVLLDIRMAEMTGMDVLRTLRRQNNPTKVIMVTGVEEPETVQSAHALGVNAFIHKPLVLEELEKIVLKELLK